MATVVVMTVDERVLNYSRCYNCKCCHDYNSCFLALMDPVQPHIIYVLPPPLPLPLPQDASKETDKPSPWTEVAKYKLAAEDELRKHKDLDHVILRPAIVYGLGEWPILGRKATYIWA